MPLEIVHSDITKMRVDAIVNPTDSRFPDLVEQTMPFTKRQALF